MDDTEPELNDSGDGDAARPTTSSVEGLLDADAVISTDTRVGVDFNRVAADTADAAPSPSRPDALIQNGHVGNGRELE